MTQRFTLGGYWLARSETLAKCVDDVGRFLATLSSSAPVFSAWYQGGRSKKEALRQKIDIGDRRKLEELLLRGRVRRDVGGDIVQELGFSIRLWNGGSQASTGSTLSIHCGCSTSRIGNSVVIDLPMQSSDWVDRAEQLLIATAEIWKPDWAGIMSNEAMMQRSPGSRKPLVDWMVYVPQRVPSVATPARVKSLGEFGSIVVVQTELPNGDSTDRLAIIREIEDQLSI